MRKYKKTFIMKLNGGTATMDEYFRNWLCRRGLYLKFKHNMIKQNINVTLFGVNDFCDFTWNKTPEGHDFWRKVNRRWKWKLNHPHVSTKGYTYKMKKVYRKKGKRSVNKAIIEKVKKYFGE